MRKSGPIRILEELEQSVKKRSNKKEIERLADTLQQAAIKAGSPLSEDGTAIFLHFGDVERVEAVGTFGPDKAEDIIPLRRIGRLNLWVGRAKIPYDAEFLYRLRVDGTLGTDPLCKESVSEEYALYSVGRMPGVKPLTELEFNRGIEHGVVESFDIYSDHLKQPRRIHVYLPPGYANTRKKYPVLYVQDGGGAIQAGRFDRIAENLLARNEIEPLILCFIPPENRIFDYWFSDYEYAQFISRELVPHIDSRYRTKTDRKYRGITGTTMGGRIATYIATNYSELFSICIGQSTYLEKNSKITERLAKGEFLPIRFYYGVGLFKKRVGMVLGEELVRDVLTVNRELISLLKRKGYQHSYREWTGNNCMLTWSRGIADALRIFWPAKKQVVYTADSVGPMRKRKSVS